MSVFELSWLRGPSSSVHENFELLCLDLLRAEFPGCEHFRLASPDCGIDILGTEVAKEPMATQAGSTAIGPTSVRIAYQCKAYARFSSDLCRAIGASMNSALEGRLHSPTLMWDRFAIILPQLLTPKQRERCESIWTKNHLQSDIRDIDWIERLLYQHGDVRSRFFPEFVVVCVKDFPLTIGFIKDREDAQDLVLYMCRFEQKVPLRCPPDLSIRGLVNILIDELRLPTQAQLHSITTQYIEIDWRLCLKSLPNTPLDKASTIRDLRLPKETELILVHSLQATLDISYFGAQVPSSKALLYDRKCGWCDISIDDETALDEVIAQRAISAIRC